MVTWGHLIVFAYVWLATLMNVAFLATATKSKRVGTSISPASWTTVAYFAQ